MNVGSQHNLPEFIGVRERCALVEKYLLTNDFAAGFMILITRFIIVVIIKNIDSLFKRFIINRRIYHPSINHPSIV